MRRAGRVVAEVLALVESELKPGVSTSYLDQIAERFPHGFRLGLLPIGAFRPEWFMHEVHISPQEAFEMQRRLAITDVLGIHFGTFKLADDAQDEPVERVRELSPHLPDSLRFLALPNGSSIEAR